MRCYRSFDSLKNPDLPYKTLDLTWCLEHQRESKTEPRPECWLFPPSSIYPLMSNLIRQGFHWGMVTMWKDMIGWIFRFESNTVCKLMCYIINSDMHPDSGLWGRSPRIQHVIPSTLTPILNFVPTTGPFPSLVAWSLPHLNLDSWLS